jgi:alpha-mannosidase
MLQDPKILGKVTRLETTYEALRYEVVSEVEMEVAETREHLRQAPADSLSWRPIKRGDKWGDNWMTGWFRGTVKLPRALDGKSVLVRGACGGPETMFLVDGRAYGVFDVNHPVRLLDLSAKANQPYQIHLEAYAGHTYPGTQPFGKPQNGDVEGSFTKNGRSLEAIEIVIERSEVAPFVNGLKALRQVALGQEEHSLRRAKIIAALGEVFAIVPQKPEEVDEAIWRKSLAEATKILQPLLRMKNGPTTPQMAVVGHSHIDTAWLWPIAETWRKCARTFSSVLSLMDQYPEFKFTSSAALHMDKMRELYPDIFRRVQERVKEGRWEINGAMWIEPDCNIPSGESFVRQCLYGQRATREMFGVTSDTLWQPDVFGYSAALPQILQKSGVEFFCTTKLSWNDTNRFPHDTFHWQGIDGTTVLAHFNEMQGWPHPENLIKLWKAVIHKDVQDRRLVGFGHGDGGGGPMAEMIEILQLSEDLEGCPKTSYQSISEFMCGARDELSELPTWVGELYLELHRGTLTSIAAIKRWNRRCEFALRDAELVATLARLQHGAAYPRAELDGAWKRLMLNQFHDILPGSSIQEVNIEALETFEACYNEAKAVSDASLAKLAPIGGGGITILNSLSWTRVGEVVLEGVPPGQQPSGCVTQRIEGVDGESRLVVTGLELPSLGYGSYALEAATDAPSAFKVDGNTIETPFAKVTFNANAEIVSFFDVGARRELVTENGAFNTFLLGEDVPAAWDNWDIDRDQRHKMARVATKVTREVVSDGPLQLRVRFKRPLGKTSSLVQDVVFHSTTSRVDFETSVDWHEKYQFLKAGFTLDVLAETARHEIQFGHVHRNSHDNTSQDRAQFDVCAHKWTDISEGEYGVAFLNDCKYACTVKEGEYRLSLIKSSRHPDPRGDEGAHLFNYAMLPHDGGFSVESVVRPAYEFNHAPTVVVGGVLGDAASLLTIDNPNVIVAAVKWAEDGEEFIVRLYEAGKTGSHVNVGFHLPVKSVFEVNLLEENPTEVEVAGNAVSTYIRPFEIKTFRCTPKR